MKKKVVNLFWAWQYEEEENWLNQKAREGWNLVSQTLFLYVFEQGEPGEYQYRLELLEHVPSHPQSRKYLEFMEETGAEMVTSYLRWVYFRKKTKDGDFELFSDMDSKIRYLERVHRFLSVLAVADIFAVCSYARIYDIEKIPELAGALLVPILLGIAIVVNSSRIWKKVKRMKKEREIHE